MRRGRAALDVKRIPRRKSDPALATARAANRLFLLDAAQLALGNMPALASNRAQDSGIGHALAKATQQLFLTFAWLEFD